MGLRNLVKKYHKYEDKELHRRAEKVKKLVPYRALKDKKIGKVKAKKKFDPVRFTNAIKNAYSLKYPKTQKVLKKIKKRKHKKQRVKIVTVYR